MNMLYYLICPNIFFYTHTHTHTHTHTYTHTHTHTKSETVFNNSTKQGKSTPGSEDDTRTQHVDLTETECTDQDLNTLHNEEIRRNTDAQNDNQTKRDQETKYGHDIHEEKTRSKSTLGGKQTQNSP